MSSENRYFGGPGSDQTPDRATVYTPWARVQRVYFFIDHYVIEEYQKYCSLLAYGFCKIHLYNPLGSQKTPESGRKVKICFSVTWLSLSYTEVLIKPQPEYYWIQNSLEKSVADFRELFQVNRNG